jgi:ankyrin repeat protein
MKYPLFECLREQYPHALEQKYERVLQKIDELWDTSEIDAYFSDLIIDTRGGRQGFPKDVLDDIIVLRDFREAERLREAEMQIDALRELERRRVTFNQREFQRALDAGDQAMVDLFVRAGINIHQEDATGSPPIVTALKKGYTIIARILLNAGADPNARDRLGLTPLLLACGKPTRGYKEIAEMLIAKGAEIHVRDRLGWSPLLLALSGGTVEIAERLIERGADLNARTRHGESALELAAKAGHQRLATLMREKGARL